MLDKLKSKVAICLAFIYIFFAFPAHFYFYAEQDPSARDGMTFDSAFSYAGNSVYTYAEGYYTCEKLLEKLPRTLEAWVYIPSDVRLSRCGVIFGNYANANEDVYINFEIFSAGVPAIVCGNENGTRYEYKFTLAAIPAEKWTHISFVYGMFDNDEESSVSCYIDGKLRHKISPNNFYAVDESFSDNKFCLGGDMRALNERFFRGTLYDVVVYSDVRTVEEIASDVHSAPDLNDTELIAYYQLSEDIKEQNIPDLGPNAYDMTYGNMWVKEKKMKNIRAQSEHDYAYSFAIVPDTQYMTYMYPSTLAVLYDWIADNVDKKNIKYVIGLGDMTDNNTEREWDTVKEQTDKLNSLVPYSLIRGNHDLFPKSTGNYFDAYYGDRSGYYYDHVTKNGGFYSEDSVANTYLKFRVGEVDYLILNLDFGANDSVLKWADKVISDHPYHAVIGVTHGYMSSDGSTIDENDYAAPSSYSKSFNDGDDMWNELFSKHKNVVMVMSGHIQSDDIVIRDAIGENGNTVKQILIDSQTSDRNMKGLGLVAMMYFTRDGKNVRIEYYSTVLKKYFRDSNSHLEFALDLPEKAPVMPEPKSVNVGKMIIIACLSTVGVISVTALLSFALVKRRSKQKIC